jgi:regulatory protein
MDRPQDSDDNAGPAGVGDGAGEGVARLRSGTVTSMEPQKKTRERVSVFIDGTFAFGVHADILLERPVATGDYLSEHDVADLLARDTYARARHGAFHLLSYRARTAAELKSRLSARGFPGETVDRVIERLRDLDLVDDEAFASEYAVARVRTRGFGPLRIRLELRRKGVPELVADEAVRDAFEGISPDVLALEAARKISDRLARFEDAAARRRHLTGYLSRRGFTYDQMQLAIEELMRAPNA